MTTTHTTLQQNATPSRTRIQTTLLDLVWAVSDVTQDDREVVATVAHLINTGQARLTGTFKNTRLIVG